MNWFRSARILLLFAAVAALAVPAFPQGSTATVGGTVRDLSGAVVPAADVLLINTGTENTLRSKTNEVGYYFFAGVIPGAYRVRVESAGMQPFEATLTVQVQQSAVVDPVLKVGQTTSSVEVFDATPVVTTDNPTLSKTLERQRIEQLPINGRSVYTLFQTIPGMEGYRAYGMREGSEELTLDGSAMVDKSTGRANYRAPGLDTIQEFRAEVNNSSARYTRPTTVVLSTKSGTNQIHGTLFETTRNNAIGKARARQDGNTAPKLIRNEFGGTVGGPLVLPKLYNGRNRTFWFTSYEGYRLVNPGTSQQRVPTQKMRDGDFSELVDTQGRVTTIYDPWSTNTQTWSRTPLTYGGQFNRIDPKRQSPMSKYLDSITPLPTMPAANPLLDVNWRGVLDSTSRQWTTSSRFDHRFSGSDLFYARYTQGDYYDYQVNGVPLSDGGANNQVTSAPNKSLAMSWVRTFSPTLVNEFLASGAYENWYIGQKERDKDFNGILGLPNPFGTRTFPQIVTNGFFAYQPINTRAAASTYFIVDDNMTKIAGRHKLEFGAHARKDMVNMLPDQAQAAGSVNPTANATGLYDPATGRTNPGLTRFTGNATASLYLGLASDKAVMNRGNFYGRTAEYALYFQDDYKVTDRLTLRLGLRWEYWPAYHEKNDLLLSFSPEKRAVVLGSPIEKMIALGATFPSVVKQFQEYGVKLISHQEAGLPQSLAYANSKNFGPRLGFAYRALDGNKAFVLRGGFSTSYWTIPMRTWGSNVKSSVPLRGEFSWNLDDAAQSPDGVANYTMRSVPSVVLGVNSLNVIDLNNTSQVTRGASTGLSYFDPRNVTPRTHAWNFTLEKQIFADAAFKASYIGNHSYGLEEWNNYNEVTPTYIWYMNKREPLPTGPLANMLTRDYDKYAYGNLKETRTQGWGNYNGVQLEIERRYSKGVGFQLFYVMSNALKSGGEATAGVVPMPYMFLPGQVPADYAERDRLLNYSRDSAIPKHRVRWNYIVDLPFGKGKFIGRNAGRVLDKFIGGWQLAGTGSLASSYFQLPSDMFPTGNKIEQYGYKHAIQDCRGGTCIPGYLWTNGYIPANRINSYDAKGAPNGVMGVPESYKPAYAPLIPAGQTALPANAPAGTAVASFWDTNTVWIPLNNSSIQRTSWSSLYPPYNNQYLPGIRTWNTDASLMKNVKFESWNLRFTADFFNVLNHPGNPTGVSSAGLLQTRNSGNVARQLQLSLRLGW
jgi:hypothetical protein